MYNMFEKKHCVAKNAKNSASTIYDSEKQYK